MDDLVTLLEQRVHAFMLGVQEGKALATHSDPSSAARLALSRRSKPLLKPFPALSGYYKRQADAQFKAEQTKFRAKLRKLYREWGLSGDTRAFLVKSEPVFRKHYTKVFRIGMSGTDLSQHTMTAGLITPADKKWIESAVQEELWYWQRFLQDIDRGRSGGKQALRRIDMYVKSAEAPFHAGKVVAAPHLTAIRWKYSPMVEKHCTGCLMLANRGPYTKESLPCTPRDGTTRCRFNCKCSLVYSEVSKADYEKYSKKSKAALLNTLRRLA